MRWLWAFLLCPGLAFAQLLPEPPDPVERSTAEQAFESSLHWRHGEVVLGDGIARIDLGEGFHFLDPDDAERVLVDAWGNPPSEHKSLGMLFLAGQGPFTPDGIGVLIRFQQDGYVSDADAAEVDYDALLAEMQESTTAANEERAKQGYPPVALVGWAARPFYDATARKFHWAKDLRFGEEDRTLNYDIRVLGRRGVLVMQAISPIQKLEAVRTHMAALLARVEFNPGHRYEDFDADSDHVAAYGIGGLVAGGLLAKAGFFKILLGALIAGKKFLIIGVFALGAAAARFLSRRPTS